MISQLFNKTPRIVSFLAPPDKLNLIIILSTIKPKKYPMLTVKLTVRKFNEQNSIEEKLLEILTYNRYLAHPYFKADIEFRKIARFHQIIKNTVWKGLHLLNLKLYPSWLGDKYKTLRWEYQKDHNTKFLKLPVGNYCLSS